MIKAFNKVKTVDKKICFRIFIVMGTMVSLMMKHLHLYKKQTRFTIKKKKNFDENFKDVGTRRVSY